MRAMRGIDSAEGLDVLIEYGVSVNVLRGPADRLNCHEECAVVTTSDTVDRQLRQ